MEKFRTKGGSWRMNKFFFLMEFIAILVKVNRCCEKKKFWDKNIFYLIKII